MLRIELLAAEVGVAQHHVVGLAGLGNLQHIAQTIRADGQAFGVGIGQQTAGRLIDARQYLGRIGQAAFDQAVLWPVCRQLMALGQVARRRKHLDARGAYQHIERALQVQGASHVNE